MGGLESTSKKEFYGRIKIHYRRDAERRGHHGSCGGSTQTPHVGPRPVTRRRDPEPSHGLGRTDDGRLPAETQAALHAPLSFLAFCDAPADMPHDAVEFVVFPRVGGLGPPRPLRVKLVLRATAGWSIQSRARAWVSTSRLVWLFSVTT